MKISIVIPNYNGEALLKKNLPKVLDAIEDEEVIVVDDASTDGSVQIIKNLKFKIKNDKEKIKIFENEKNLGFSSTVNRGVNEATGDLIVLLNTDVNPEKDFLKTALPHFEDSKVFAVGFLQKCPENGKVILRGRGVGKFEKGLLIHDRGAVIGEDTSEVAEWTPRMVEEPMKTLWVSGGAGIFRKSIWEKLGGLDTLYNPFYWEDIDISYRALKQGYKIIFEPKSVVTHDQGQTIESSYPKNRILPIVFRNQILFIWLNITDINYLVEHVLYLPYHIVTTLLSGNFNFIKGLLMACFKLRKVINLHNQYRQKIVLSDKKLLQQFVT